ncbi:MAG: NAD(P)/FAD-dependent oxidoreductase [Candidatus Microthrix parvicella]|nr:NAD(P)/FAD-dependent oxidoreductase [Candidatus Microthrix parvicella]
MRRCALRLATAAGGVTVLPGGRPRAQPDDPSPVSDVNFVVVGAGISGLAVADGLIRAGRSVRVFEAGPTLGGRIRSVEVPGGHADLGPTWF